MAPVGPSVTQLRAIQAHCEQIHAEWNLCHPTHVMAVTKTQPIEAIVPLLDAGHRFFGENRVQEAKRKWPALRARVPDLELHLIGPLQSNKIKEAVSLFDGIETLDRPKLAPLLAEESAKQGKVLRCWVEVNLGQEPQKSGILPCDLPKFLENLCSEFGGEASPIRIEGLMAIPPQKSDPTPYFRRLKRYADDFGLESLSMGMTADYPIAVALGATIIRIGAGLFGPR